MSVLLLQARLFFGALFGVIAILAAATTVWFLVRGATAATALVVGYNGTDLKEVVLMFVTAMAAAMMALIFQVMSDALA